MSDINTDGGGVQLLSSTDSTYCPSEILLFNDLSCGIGITDECVTFSDFFQLSSASSSVFKWNPDIAIADNYHTTYKNKLLTRKYFEGYIPQGSLFSTYFTTRKTFFYTSINRLSSGSNSVTSSGMNQLTVSNGRASINGSNLAVNTTFSNSGTLRGIIIVIKDILITNKSTNANKNLLQITNPSVTGVDDLDNGIQIGFQPNNSFYFRNYMNSPWRSFYATEVPVIDDTSGFSAAFLFTGGRLISIFYARGGTTPSTVLRNTYSSWAGSIIGANPSSFILRIGSKLGMEQPFQGSFGDIQIGFIHSWT